MRGDVGRAIIVLASALVASVTLVSACGITTHIEIAHRSLALFNNNNAPAYQAMLAAHQDAFQAGNPYPDAMYNSMCFHGNYHAVAEDTHWTGFLNATINYIRRKYGPQSTWDTATQKLVVFTLGYVSHQVADVSWHSLGIPQGFLAAMGDVNFFGSFDNAHSVGDEGGDVLVQFELDTSYVSTLTDWYVPTSDLVEIYREFYGADIISGTVIDECVAWLFLGRLGEKLALAKIFKEYAHKSTFLVDEFSTYFLGGVDDMALWTSFVWNSTLTMLEDGVDACDVPHSALYIRCPNTTTDTDSPAARDARQPARRGAPMPRPLYLDTLFRDPQLRSLTGVSRTPCLRGTCLSMVAAPEAPVATTTNANADAVTVPHNEVAPTATYATSTAYARLGAALASGDFNGDGRADLALGAPGHGVPGDAQRGRVYVVNGSAFPLRDRVLDIDADYWLDGPKSFGRFGSGLAVVDLNADGLDDLAVSAPSLGVDNLTYTGEVYVFFGRKGAGLAATPDVTLTSAAVYDNIGWVLASGDVDGDSFADLVVGAPFSAGLSMDQSGFVAVCFSNQTQSGPVTQSCGALLYGDQPYAWFGHDLHVSKSGVLLVGSASQRLCASANCTFSPADVQSVGRVTAFQKSTIVVPVREARAPPAPLVADVEASAVKAPPRAFTVNTPDTPAPLAEGATLPSRVQRPLAHAPPAVKPSPPGSDSALLSSATTVVAPPTPDSFSPSRNPTNLIVPPPAADPARVVPAVRQDEGSVVPLVQAPPARHPPPLESGSHIVLPARPAASVVPSAHQPDGLVHAPPAAHAAAAPVQLTAVFSVTGSEAFAKLSPSAVGLVGPGQGESLFLALPAANSTGFLAGQQSGIVVAVPLTSLHGDVSFPAEVSVSTLWAGDRDYGRFGARVLAADLNGDSFDDAVFSAPYRTDDLTEELLGAEQGLVYIYFGGRTFPAGNATAKCGVSSAPCPAAIADLVLTFPENRARLGGAMVATDGRALAVAAERSSRNARLGGAVAIYLI